MAFPRFKFPPATVIIPLDDFSDFNKASNSSILFCNNEVSFNLFSSAVLPILCMASKV